MICTLYTHTTTYIVHVLKLQVVMHIVLWISKIAINRRIIGTYLVNFNF